MDNDVSLWCLCIVPQPILRTAAARPGAHDGKAFGAEARVQDEGRLHRHNNDENVEGHLRKRPLLCLERAGSFVLAKTHRAALGVPLRPFAGCFRNKSDEHR